MINFIEKNKHYVMILAILFVLISLSGPTYSLFVKSNTIDNLSYETGILDLEFIEDEPIVLETALPINDSEGIALSPYTLTIKNTGTLPYLFNLKMISSEENSIDPRYIKVKVNNNLPKTLFLSENIIASDIIINPNQELTFKINVWLDKDTPNDELGKSFTAKIITTGNSIYKTLDASGANYPILKDNMLPVYYDQNSGNWKKATASNLDTNNRWYNYDELAWANSVSIINSERFIYDITGKNNLSNSNIQSNNGNLIVENSYLDIGLNDYQGSSISSIMRLKVTDKDVERLSFITNDKISYYYDVSSSRFIFENDSQKVQSEPYQFDTFRWYTIGFTYDGTTICMYVDGKKISEINIVGSISNSHSFKIGRENCYLIVDDIYVYSDILTPDEINQNYGQNTSIIKDNLLSGYTEFTPMTKEEYYLSSPSGTIISSSDIKLQYVWIPRFKYRVWNVLGDSSKADITTKGIDIVFENGITNSGNIFCHDLICYNNQNMTTQVNNNDNLKYYTHPAFMNLDESVTGLWVSKYEIKTNTDCHNNATCLSTDLTLFSNKNGISWTDNYLSNYYQIVKKLGEDYHLIKNSEWGAVAYLTYSKYGICNENGCLSENDSTTLNEYGVYEMSNENREFVMATYVDESHEISLEDTHFGNTPISNYDYDAYYDDKFILGDATKEISNSNITSNFVDNTNRWFVRGGNNSLLSYDKISDSNYSDVTSRVVVK